MDKDIKVSDNQISSKATLQFKRGRQTGIDRRAALETQRLNLKSHLERYRELIILLPCTSYNQ